MQSVQSLVRVVKNKRNRRWVAAGVLLLTLFLVIRFFVSHPEYWRQLGNVSPGVIIAVILLNIPAMAGLAWANDAMLRLCGKPMQPKENALLTAYSSIVNFFGPLQSGPGVRAVYLKTRHNVRMRDYMLATLLYCGLYAGLSALFLLVGVRPWWQTLLVLLAVLSASVVVISWFMRRERRAVASGQQHFAFRAWPLAALMLAVLLQLSFIAAYFYVELRAVDPHISVGQATSYAGAANFSLFVSITPDAVGIREAFLVFSQHIHHVPTADILKANVIDRGAYVVYLVLLLAVVLSIHAKDRLHIKGWRQVAGKAGQ